MQLDSVNVQTLRWRDGRLELIDQRRLPLEFEYVACESAAQTADAIRDMVVRGAPAALRWRRSVRRRRHARNSTRH